MKTSRNIKIEPISSINNRNRGAKLRIKGIWLHQLGFHPGNSVKVETKFNTFTGSYQLVITPNK